MNILDKNNPTLDGMTYEQAIDLIRSIREDRKVSKRAVSVKKAREIRTRKGMSIAFEALSAEEQAALLQLLQEGTDES